MFNTISWQSYWTTLAICSAIYYLVIILMYYRNELKLAFQKTFTKAAEQSFVLHEEFQTPSRETGEGIVYACMDELNAFFDEAKKRRWNKNEMICSLQMIMKKYPAIKSSGYQQSVSKVLRNQCEHLCNIHLDKEELDHVWLG